MVSYPIDLMTQGDGSYRVVAPHFPEFEAFGDTEDDAMMHAGFALEEVITERMAKRQVVPVPLKTAAAGRAVTLPAPFADLLESYWKYNIGTFPPDRIA
jgi:predicted RNase H-like HicB family nuclease